MPEQDEWWTLGYMLDVILTRDPFMHRVDICRAAGVPMVADGRPRGRHRGRRRPEWAGRHGRAYDARADRSRGWHLARGCRRTDRDGRLRVLPRRLRTRSRDRTPDRRRSRSEPRARRSGPGAQLRGGDVSQLAPPREPVGTAVVVLALVGPAGARKHEHLGPPDRPTSPPRDRVRGARAPWRRTPPCPCAVKASNAGSQRSTSATSRSISTQPRLDPWSQCPTRSVSPRPWSTTLWSSLGAQRTGVRPERCTHSQKLLPGEA